MSETEKHLAEMEAEIDELERQTPLDAQQKARLRALRKLHSMFESLCRDSVDVSSVILVLGGLGFFLGGLIASANTWGGLIGIVTGLVLGSWARSRQRKRRKELFNKIRTETS